MVSTRSKENNMPGCVLRVAGSKEKIRKFLASSSFKPEAVYFKGERKSAKSVWKSSGFNLMLSGSEGIQKQAAGAARFIKLNKNEFERMKDFGFKTATIDFGLYDTSTDKYPWPTYHLSKNIIVLAAAYCFEIELSIYGKQ